MATERFSQAEPGGFEIGAIRTIGRNPKFSIEPQEDRHQFHIPNFLFPNKFIEPNPTWGSFNISGDITQNSNIVPCKNAVGQILRNLRQPDIAWRYNRPFIKLWTNQNRKGDWYYHNRIETKKDSILAKFRR
ncbi:hypothetical protein V1477_015747 [Vespula maculifrons]|uniref:Uncharacterized protein n=1 Tax=Vespula maculifrons TaxID=7453 RepID=A0ABD2BB27_VESMC